MKTLLLVSLAGVAAGATPAQAHPTYDYYGGCGYFAVSDGTDSPQTQWDGEIDVVAFAVDAGTGTLAPVQIDVECELRINGATAGTVVFSASGIGAAVNAAQFSFHADPDDDVDMCDKVTAGGDYHKDCGTTTMGGYPETYEKYVDMIFDMVDTRIEEMCRMIMSMSGGPADQPPAFDIHSDGDIYVDGSLIWDCPPYGTSGS